MTSKQFAKIYDYVNSEQQEKIETVFNEYGLLLDLETDFATAFEKLPKSIKERVTSILIPDEINFNRFGAEQTTKVFGSDTKEADLLNEIWDEYWEAYYEIMCSQGVTITYVNADDEFVVDC